MKSVYIAGRYWRRDEFRPYRDELEKRGIHVTSTWLDETTPLDGKPSDLPDEVNAKIAHVDVEDVFYANSMIFFAEDPYNQPPRGGRHVEFGMALGSGKRIYVIGWKENIFHYLPDVYHFPTFEDLLKEIDAGNIN